jgi:hypothetical protein
MPAVGTPNYSAGTARTGFKNDIRSESYLRCLPTANSKSQIAKLSNAAFLNIVPVRAEQGRK